MVLKNKKKLIKMIEVTNHESKYQIQKRIFNKINDLNEQKKVNRDLYLTLILPLFYCYYLKILPAIENNTVCYKIINKTHGSN